MVQELNCGRCNMLRPPIPNFGPAALRWHDPQLLAGEQLRLRFGFWTLRDTVESRPPIEYYIILLCRGYAPL